MGASFNQFSNHICMGPIFIYHGDMVYMKISPYENNSFTNSCNIQLLSLKLVLPLSFARLEFKVCKGQPFLN
jgi:hypothetical protein